MPAVEVDKVLAEAADELFAAEEAMKKQLDETRKTKKNMAKATWQENLYLVSRDAEERRHWAVTIEKDAAEQKKIKRQAPSSVFVQGPSSTKSPTVNLARLLIKSSVKAGIKLPKNVLTDLEKSGLPERYSELTSGQLNQKTGATASS